MVPYHEWTNELPTLHSHLVIQKEWIFVLSKSGFNPPLKITRIILNCGNISSTLCVFYCFLLCRANAYFRTVVYVFCTFIYSIFLLATLLNKDKNECRICICKCWWYCTRELGWDTTKRTKKGFLQRSRDCF